MVLASRVKRLVLMCYGNMTKMLAVASVDRYLDWAGRRTAIAIPRCLGFIAPLPYCSYILHPRQVLHALNSLMKTPLTILERTCVSRTQF